MSSDAQVASRPDTPAPDAAHHNPNHDRRWLVLCIVALAQLTVVLDSTIVSIALPQAQHALGITDADRHWVVTAYALAFGALLLLGGRIADFWGRKRSFMVGMIGFAIASAVGGIAQTGLQLFAARAGQGVFAALLAPAALAILTTTFVGEKERAKAFAVFGAISGGGAAIGLLLGGLLTQYVDWRWCLLVNIPIALFALAVTAPIVKETKAHGDTSYDVPGTVLVAIGLGSLVYGFTQAEKHGWASAQTIGFIAVGLIALVLFVLVEKRTANPLLPMSVPWHRNRGPSFLASVMVGAALLGGTLYLTFYLQIVLGFSPFVSGLASLPLSIAITAAAGLAAQLSTRIGPKLPMTVGPVVAAAGLLLLSRIEVHGSYWTGVLPGLLVFGAGLGLLMVPMQNVALVGVRDHDAGAASALVNATMQIGGALGTALFTTIYVSAKTGTDIIATGPGPDALRDAALAAEVAGYSHVFLWSAALIVLVAPVVAALVRAEKHDLPTEGAVGAH